MNRRTIERRTALGSGVAAALGLAAASAQAAEESSTWDRIRGKGELRIGVTSGEPWFYKDPATGAWSGIGYAAGDAMAKELGAKLIPVETSWGNAVAGLQANQFDVMFVLDATPQRALAVDFPVQPFFYYAQGVLLRDGLAAKTWKDLDRPELRIGVTLGTAPDRDVTARLPHAQIERFPTNDQSILAFQSGHVDAVSLYHPALVMQRQRVNMGTIVLPEPIRASTTSAGVRREADKTWRDWLGTALGFYYVTGQTQQFYDAFLRSRGIDPSQAPGVMEETWRSHG
ncbi:MAG: transporter substrate-binding domain-containing protein [Acidisphaera sp.]|nr:transporter substrate-binding domain-containing protein [Acidisphaera sp.]